MFVSPFWILVDDFLTYFWQGSGILFNILKRGQGRAQRSGRPDHSVDALRSRRLPLLEDLLYCLSCLSTLSSLRYFVCIFKLRRASRSYAKTGLIVDARPLGLGENSQIVFIETKSKVPREFYIKKEDLEEHGYTRGCGGCSSVFRGLARQAHNDVCRERAEEYFEGRRQGKECRRSKEGF